ncbi:MAG: hypothetical protein WDW36_010037 [Sanguina aurantia]
MHLQFPRLKTGFLKVRELFTELDVEKKGIVSIAHFKLRCGNTGIDPTSLAMAEIWSLEKHQKSFSSNEFLLVLTIVYLLDDATKSCIQKHPEVHKALEMVESAFMFFDSSSDGCLERAEMLAAMKAGSTMRKGQKLVKSAADRLFDTLDDDGSGTVTFKEFLFGIEKMVLENAGAEDELEDNDWEEVGGGTFRHKNQGSQSVSIASILKDNSATQVAVSRATTTDLPSERTTPS